VTLQKQKPKMPKQKPTNDLHSPVLLQEVLVCLDPQNGESYLDLTAGYGGHAASVIEATRTPEQAVLVDRDQNAVNALNARFKGQGPATIQSDFLSALQMLASEGRQFDMVLADLGLSSPHLEQPQRGFSFQRTGPLDMRMDQSQALSADQLVNHSTQDKLAAILSEYGEEPKARAIAKAIVSHRPIQDTEQLAATIAKAAGFSGRLGKIHPATRSFQAIRIAVNDELEQLKQGLPFMLQVLAPGGRLAIISFHSLEDRMVKQFLADKAGNTYDAELKLLSKKPITASRDEIVSNPRSRSAKLRAAAKIKIHK
jgi:16S rRNA (cytosine1402-N4)-methyltransferase